MDDGWDPDAEPTKTTVEISTGQHEIYERHSATLGDVCGMVAAATGRPDTAPYSVVGILNTFLRLATGGSEISGLGVGDRLTAELSRYVCDSYGTLSKWGHDVDPGVVDSTGPTSSAELIDRRRIDKVGEEFGEVIDAYGSYVGENPRKRDNPEYPRKTLADVQTELLDVALTALGAFDHLDGHSGKAFHELLEHAARRHHRAGLA